MLSGRNYTMITGSCLCRQVQFAIIDDGILGMGNCHCTECRKAYGSAFGTVLVCRKEHFEFTRGQQLISSYKQTERVTRYFCGTCGSPLPMVEEWDALVGVPAGLLDADPGVAPSEHIFVAYKAPWWHITDEIPQYKEWSPDSDPSGRDDVTLPKTGNE
jgi:hypothetical protein